MLLGYCYCSTSVCPSVCLSDCLISSWVNVATLTACLINEFKAVVAGTFERAWDIETVMLTVDTATLHTLVHVYRPHTHTHTHTHTRQTDLINGSLSSNCSQILSKFSYTSDVQSTRSISAQISSSQPFNGHIKTAPQRTITQQYGDWYTGRWWVGCYIWYSDEGPGQAAAPPSPLLAVPNVTAHAPVNGQCTNFILYDVAL